MTLAYLLLLLPIILALQAGYKCFQWLRSGTAGAAGYEYTRSEDPFWFHITIGSALILVLFYLISGLFLFLFLRASGGRFHTTWTLLYLVLAISQTIGLHKKDRSQAACHESQSN